VNLAKEKTTQASSVLNAYSANLAVDGRTDTWLRSNNLPDEWWRVDLDDVRVVKRIVITTGASKC